MIKARYALLLLPLALAACSSDDDDDTTGTDTDTPITEPVGSTYQITFTNRSTEQPMTPPVAAIHDPEVDIYEVGEAASEQVTAIAERGEIDGLRDLLTGLVGSGVASTAVALTVPGTPGPVMPGESATITLTSDSETQVLSFVSMIVCTNDGFTGFDGRALSVGVETAFAQNYDAGSEENTLTADYWVPPCGTETNLHVDENGVIAVHPGQEPVGDEAVRGFAAGAELMEVQITRN